MKVTTKAIEVLEDAIARLLETVEGVQKQRDECSNDFIQNAQEQEREFGNKPRYHQEIEDTYESLEEGLDEVYNHIRHAQDIVTDTLPIRIRNILGYRLIREAN